MLAIYLFPRQLLSTFCHSAAFGSVRSIQSHGTQIGNSKEKRNTKAYMSNAKDTSKRNNPKQHPSTPLADKNCRRKLLVLHGDRQTGELLVGRIASLKRKLLRPRHVR